MFVSHRLDSLELIMPGTCPQFYFQCDTCRGLATTDGMQLGDRQLQHRIFNLPPGVLNVLA